MNASELQVFLHEEIPLASAMGVEVRQAGAACVRLSAPLAPNINYHDTVFGGSAGTLAILSVWSLLHLRMAGEGLDGTVVIQRSSMHYLRPAADDFEAVCTLDDLSAWDRFKTTLVRKRRARIAMRARVECRGEIVGEFEGDFVALGSPS